MRRIIDGFLEMAAWCALGAGIVLAVTQTFGWSSNRYLAVLQSLTPHLTVLLVVIALGWALRERMHVAFVAAACAAPGLVVMAPAAYPVPALDAADGSPTLTIAHANLLYSNDDRADAAIEALLDTSPDVVALSEFTPKHEASLIAAASTEYPFRAGRAIAGTEGIGLWSRFPLVDVTFAPIGLRLGIVATVQVPSDSGGDAPVAVRVVAVHPIPPISDLGMRTWEPSLNAIGDVASSPGPPTVIVGDFNASRWHPPFRDLLDRGWRDAHESFDRGFSASWPTDEGFAPPPFIRLDHALTDARLTTTSIEDVRIPGSDHLAFVVVVALAASA